MPVYPTQDAVLPFGGTCYAYGACINKILLQEEVFTKMKPHFQAPKQLFAKGGGRANVSVGRSSDDHTPANRDFEPCWWGGEPRKDIVLF